MQDMIQRVNKEMSEYLHVYNRDLMKKRKRLDLDRGRKEHIKAEIRSLDQELTSIQEKLSKKRKRLSDINRNIVDGENECKVHIGEFGSFAQQFTTCLKHNAGKKHRKSHSQ